jgi:hypothetical protein
MTSRSLIILAGAALALATLGACGGDDAGVLDAGERVTTTVADDTSDDRPGPTIDAGTTTSAAAASSDYCAAAQEIAAFDAEFDGRLGAAIEPIDDAAAAGDEDAMDVAMDDFIATMKELGDVLPEIDADYAALGAAAPAERRQQIETVRTFTVDFVEQLQSVRSLDDMVQLTESMEGAREAGLASLALDGYTRDVCGFSLNNE